MIRELFLVARNSFAYSLGALVPALLGVTLLPIYTRYLTPSDYGITATALSINLFLTALYELGLLAAYGRFYFSFRHDASELSSHISTTTVFLGFYGLLLSTVLSTCGQWVFERLIPEVPFAPYIQMAIWAGYFQLIFLLRLNLYLSEMRARKYLAFNVAHIITTHSLTILLVVVCQGGPSGYLGAILCSNAVFSALSLYLLRHHFTRRFQWSKLKAGLRYGLALVPTRLGVWMYHSVDRIMLTTLLGTNETGLYAVGFAVGQVVSLIATAVNSAWSPLFFAQMTDHGDEAKPMVARFSTFWVLAMCFMYLATSGFSPELIALLATAPYRESFSVVPLVALGFLFGGCYYIVVAPLFWLRKTPLVATATISSGVLNVVLNSLLIPRLGILGAGAATAISNLYCLVFTGYFSLRLFPVAYEFGRLAKIALATGLVFVLMATANYCATFWLTILMKLLILLTFPALLLSIGFLEEDERRTAKELLSRAWTGLRRRSRAE